MRPTPVLLVQGTWSWGRSSAVEWWQCRSPFCAFLCGAGCAILGADRPFVWTTNLDGIGFLKRDSQRHLDWSAAGVNLWAYLVPPLAPAVGRDTYVPIPSRNLIGHSHAMQVIAYACASGLKVNRLITIGSPVREDMKDVYRLARPNIASWLHVHSDGSDKMQWFGELFDGHFGIVREQPFADRNVSVAKVSHSKLLNDPAAFPFWTSAGLLDFLLEDTDGRD